MITCEQSRNIAKGFLEATIAERLAFRTHCQRYKKCRRWLESTSKPTMDIIKAIPGLERAMESAVLTVRNRDLQDPEAK